MTRPSLCPLNLLFSSFTKTSGIFHLQSSSSLFHPSFIFFVHLRLIWRWFIVQFRYHRLTIDSSSTSIPFFTPYVLIFPLSLMLQSRVFSCWWRLRLLLSVSDVEVHRLFMKRFVFMFTDLSL
jgi:hypothetical protein